MRGGGSGIACPGFSVLRFRREFLSRMRIPKGNWTRMSSLARFGMDADRGRPQPMITCAILLRNSQPKKVHGKPGQAIPLPPPPKKLPPVRPPLNTTFQAELLCLNCFHVKVILTRMRRNYIMIFSTDVVCILISFKEVNCQTRG